MPVRAIRVGFSGGADRAVFVILNREVNVTPYINAVLNKRNPERDQNRQCFHSLVTWGLWVEARKLTDSQVQVQVIGELIFQAVQAVVLLLMILLLQTEKFNETEYVMILDCPLERSLFECVILMACIRVGEDTLVNFMDVNTLE